MSDLFLCHSSLDKSFARGLATDLEKLGVDVWFDEWELEVGDSLHRCIGKALCESNFIGVVLSPDSVSSRWCQDELEQALAIEKRSDSVFVLPLLHRSVSVPPFLEGRLHLDFESGYFAPLTHLAGVVKDLDKKVLLRFIASKAPKSFEQCVEILGRAGKDSRYVFVYEEDYRNIREALERNGVYISKDLFKIIVSRDEAEVIIVA